MRVGRVFATGWVIVGLAGAAGLWAYTLAGGLIWGALYALSLVNPTYDCPKCGGHNERVAGGLLSLLWRMLTPGAHTRGCRSRWCYGGQRLRLGVRLFRREVAREITGR